MHAFDRSSSFPSSVVIVRLISHNWSWEVSTIVGTEADESRVGVVFVSLSSGCAEEKVHLSRVPCQKQHMTSYARHACQ